MRTRGGILMFCIAGCAVVEYNFTRRPFRRGCMTAIFSDTLFSVEKVSRDFRVRIFELSVSLADEATFLSSGPFFDWLDETQVFIIPETYRDTVKLWIREMEWIEKHCIAGYKEIMMRNQWQNFFLGFESVVRPMLETRDMKTISSSRRLFNQFCQLLCENCRTRHDVRFYADKLCITPYYLSRVTYLIFKVSPKELIDRQLMMELKAALTTTHLTVKEIADRFCFESPSYLGRYFRKHAGMTPIEYRERHSGS